VNSNGTVDKKFKNHWIFRLCQLCRDKFLLFWF
jgi:hypothetical protein